MKWYLQEVAAWSAELRASVQEAQGNLSSVEIQLQHVAATALPHTPALSAEDLCNAEAIRGRLAELAAAKVLTATGLPFLLNLLVVYMLLNARNVWYCPYPNKAWPHGAPSQLTGNSLR